MPKLTLISCLFRFVLANGVALGVASIAACSAADDTGTSRQDVKSETIEDSDCGRRSGLTFQAAQDAYGPFQGVHYTTYVGWDLPGADADKFCRCEILAVDGAPQTAHKLTRCKNITDDACSNGKTCTSCEAEFGCGWQLANGGKPSCKAMGHQSLANEHLRCE